MTEQALRPPADDGGGPAPQAPAAEPPLAGATSLGNGPPPPAPPAATAPVSDDAAAVSPFAVPRRRLVAVWLVVLGLAAVVVGFHDAGRGDEVQVRVVGTLVLSAGAILLAGAVGLVHNTRQGRSLGTLACLLGVVLGLMLAATQLTQDRVRPVLALWLAIAAISALVAIVLRRDLPVSERDGWWRRLVALKSVVSIGVLIGVTQFWYTSIYLPAAAPPSLTVSVAMRELAPTERSLPLALTVTIHNTSGTRVNSLASLALVTDRAVEPDATLPDEQFRADLDESARADPQQDPFAARRYGREGDAEVVLFSQVLPEGTFLQDGETITVPLTVVVPRRRFHIASTSIAIGFARASLRLETDRLTQRREGSDVVTTTPVAEAGWLRQLTRGERYVQVKTSVDPAAPGADVAFSDRPDGSASDGFNERLRRGYGFSWATATADAPLSDPKARRR